MLNRIAIFLMFLSAMAVNIGLIFAQEPPSPLPTGPNEGHFLIVTDIHFNPFTQPTLVPELDRNPVSEWPAIFKKGAGKNFQGYGNDAGYPLMISALEAAAAQGFRYDYLLYTGDYLSHRFGSDYDRYAGPAPQGLTSFATKTTRFVSLLLKETFGDIPIFGVLGNTDAACGDYRIAPNGAYINGFKDQWAGLSRQPDRFTHFGNGGFYKVAHPTVPDQDIIILNNIFWTPRYSDSCNLDGSDPGSVMLSWLDKELDQTRQADRKAQILMHVPPGINAFSTSRQSGSCEDQIRPFWKARYSSGFIDLMRKYAGVVDYTFSGHTHMDNFAIIKDANGKPLVASQITPAVSPIFGNNPAFTVFRYNRENGEFKDSATFYLANLPAAERGEAPEWKHEYTYSQAYSVSNLSADNRAEVASRLMNEPQLRKTFIEFYAVSAEKNNPITPASWQAFACAHVAIDPASYRKCYCSQQ